VILRAISEYDLQKSFIGEALRSVPKKNAELLGAKVELQKQKFS